MVTFDPRGWLDPFGRSGGGAGGRSRDLNRETAGRWAGAVAFCLCFASLAPAPLFPFAVSGLLFLAGCASIGVALVQRTPPLAPYLTSWDGGSLVSDGQPRLATLARPAPGLVKGCKERRESPGPTLRASAAPLLCARGSPGV